MSSAGASSPVSDQRVKALPHRLAPSYPGAMVSSGGDMSEPVEVWRALIIKGIPTNTSVSEVLDIVQAAIVEHIRYVPQRGAAVISFLDQVSAMLFFGDFMLNPPTIRGYPISISWGRAPLPSLEVVEAVAAENACRNVYLGMLPSDITEKEIIQDLGVYGQIEQVRLLSEFDIGFVHFLSISSAIAAVQGLKRNPKWSERKISYGRDRCFNLTKLRKQAALTFLGKAPNDTPALQEFSTQEIIGALSCQVTAAISLAFVTGGAENIGNRCIYIGNIHPDAEIHEICNTTRGGLVENIRYLPERHICFIRFAEPTAAANFYAMWNLHRLYIHNRCVKVSWGKPSGPLSPELAEAIANGTTRNVSISELPSRLSIEQVREDFSQFGCVEQVNELADRNCAFLSFTDLHSAIEAVAWAKTAPRYIRTRIRFGKDRCANQPRLLQNLSANGERPPSALLQFLQVRTQAIATAAAAHQFAQQQPPHLFTNHLYGSARSSTVPASSVNHGSLPFQSPQRTMEDSDSETSYETESSDTEELLNCGPNERATAAFTESSAGSLVSALDAVSLGVSKD